MLDDQSLRKDFDFLCKQTEYQKIVNMSRYKNKMTTLSSVLKKFKYNFFMKIERVGADGSFPSIVIFHLDSKSADSVLSDHGLSPNLVNLLVKYSDLVLDHDNCVSIE